MQQPQWHATTVLGVLHNGQTAMAADGQATMGNVVAKNNVRKLRKLANGEVLVGFAGATADAFTLLERFEEHLAKHSNQLRRASIELAKAWRTDRYLRNLQAMMVVMNRTEGLLVSGNGDVLEPEDGLLAIGSGGQFALAAARALKKHAPQLDAETMAREALTVAADLCIYTNHNLVIEHL